ncbi:MAG: hypothetical protein E7576_11490 [Ruminococcaceae bacterium]|nr:hypothetical protein [Oscillospiraceae bacterium]
MAGLFLSILSMSLTGSAVILAVLLARVCLRRAPKKVSYLLWIPVAFRLICPVSFSTPLSLFRLPGLEAEVSHISAALSENIDTVDIRLDGSETTPSGPADSAAPSPASDPVEPISMPDTAEPAEPALPVPTGGQTPPAPENETPALSVDDPAPAEQTPANERPAEPVWENPAAVTELPPVTQTIPSGNDGTPAPTHAGEPASDPELPVQPVQPDGTADETPDLPPPDSSEESLTFWERIAGIRARILTPLSVVWLAGVAAVLLYGVVSTLAIRRMMATAVWREDNVWESDRMRSPFILGLIRPKIYIPFGLEGDCRRYVLAHERYHLRCRDDLTKAAGWGILALHWFNPLVWLAFRLMSRDMEMRCDEAVLSGSADEAGNAGIARAYSMSLLSFAADEQIRFPLSPAFGECDVETRIRRILDWKKPKIWVSVLAGVLVLAVILVCASDPVTAADEPTAQAATDDTPESGPDSTPDEDKTAAETAAFVPLTKLPAGDWTPLAAAAENVLYTTGGWMEGSLSSYVAGYWNGWYRGNGAFCSTTLHLMPYTKDSFRWIGSAGEVSYDYRGTYRIGEDGLLTARFGAGNDEAKPFEAVFRVRYDARHDYGTEYREVLGVTLVSSTAPGFDPWIGRELPMTGAQWFRGDLNGNPADAIVKMTPADGEFFPPPDAFFCEMDSADLVVGEHLDSFSPEVSSVAMSVSDLGDLILYAERAGESGKFLLTSFRWQGVRVDLPRPLRFEPYRFHLLRGEQFAWFTEFDRFGESADTMVVFLTEDGAYCLDSRTAGLGYALALWPEQDGKTVGWSRTNPDFLNMQTYEELLRFRGREDDFCYESGTLRYDGDGRFVFSYKERLTGSEWFEEQKKTEPERYPEETFGSMSFREYLSDYLPREIRDNTLRAKGLFTPEEAETIAYHLIDGMSPRTMADKGFAFGAAQVQGFLMRLGLMTRNADTHPFPAALSSLWTEWPDGEGISRANACRIAEEMFGVFPSAPGELSSNLFRYDEAGDRFVVNPTGGSHGYFTMEDVSTVWDDVSVTVRFRLVTYVPDGTGQSAGIYADERTDCGEYRLIFYKTNSLYTWELPRILFAKRGEIEADGAPEPPVGDEVKAAIVYPDFFDEEQRDLYARALVLFPAVWGTSGSYIEDAFPRKDGEPFVSGRLCPAVTVFDPERGYDLYCHICRGRYERWADLDAAGRALFTGELWESITGPGQRCMNYGGKTCVQDADAGGNGYDPALDRFELVEKTEDRIVYWFITSNRARGTFEIESSERTLVTMVKTAEGWRFGSFRVGTWLPAGTETERMTVHVNTPEEAESLVRMLVRDVMDVSWRAGRISYTPADALNLTQGLKTAFTDAFFPFREAVSHDGHTWRIHADHIRNAARELFGIRDFDYFAAAREVYGEDADVSASIDGMGWISFPADIGNHTASFDVSELYSYEENGAVRVFAHLVTASDDSGDPTDCGIYCFTFAPNFDGPGLTVERTAAQWSRADVEAEIARLTGQRTIAVNDMNSASERTVELEGEIRKMRVILEAESGVTIEDRTYASARLEELYAKREQQVALAERCLNAVKEFAARIRVYEQILAEMDGGSYTDDPLSARLRGLTAEDILSLASTFDHITAEELAPILNRTGILGGQPAPEDFRAYYTLDVYLSETPSGGFGSESETLTLFAGLEEDLVRILWSGKGTNTAEERFVRDAALYRILRENYRLPLMEQIDADAFEKWGEPARERAAETVENTRGMDGRPAFTDYRIVSFAVADTFERDGAKYTVCSWDPVYLTNDPDNVVWAGGMLLDADGRVVGAELETYLAEQWTESGTRTVFLMWDLYNGPDRETGLAWGRDRIVEAFERLENEGDGISQDPLLSYTLAPVFTESVRTGLYKREITILGFESDSAHCEEINAFLGQGEATRASYLNGVRDTEHPSPEWYDNWVLRISASGAEYGDLLFLTVRTIRPSTYIDVPRYDTLILDRRTDRLISLDEAASALGFDAEKRTAAAKEAFVGSIGGLREDQEFKYFEFRDFAAIEGRLYGRYEYDFHGVDSAQDWLELVDKGSVLTAEDADTLAMELSRYLRITEIDSASVPHDAAVADETGLYFKVTDQEFASWDGWQAFVRKLFTEEAAQRILTDPDGVMKEVGGLTFVRPGAGGGFDPNRYTCAARYEEGRYKLIVRYSAPPSDESGSVRRVFPLRYENGAWRVERMESEPVAALTFNPDERTASSLDELSNLGLNENDARLAYVRAFVTGDVDRLEEVSGVPSGMYAGYGTVELSSWTAWIDPDEDWGPLRFAFVPLRSDVEAFPTDTRIEGTVYEGLSGAYFTRDETPASYGEAADELVELLSRHILLDLPTTDEMDYPTRFELTCYICSKLGDADLTEEAYRTYAEKHFGIEHFTPDGGHVGLHGGHGGSHQVLEIVGSEEQDGATVVTVQYYADLSKTVKSSTWQYTVRKTDDGWLFAGSEEIRHSDYGRAMWSM